MSGELGIHIELLSECDYPQRMLHANETILYGNRALDFIIIAYASASTSIVINTSSPTTTPPFSKSPFQLTPKSWRLILVVP